ncbi:TVP38/TMEM64 family protein [Paenibacillus sp. GCM10023252]|uniref:TVP38/TMEM64 family protein n=1 Tax=Paenibacillus sp. GCM10023252 TaxID=3252649 RepID=UPI003609D6A4
MTLWQWQWQEWISYVQNIDLEHLQRTLESYSAYGPLPGILLPFIESFLPFLPLVVFIAANVNIYGLGLGFLYSWIGVSAGGFLLFLLARRLGRRVKPRIMRRFPKSERFFNWIEEKGFTPLFLMACFPFAPSAVITLIAGISTVPLRTFLLATILGKAVMILIISLLSFDITSMLQEPWRVIVSVAVVGIMWFGGKRIEARYHVG